MKKLFRFPRRVSKKKRALDTQDASQQATRAAKLDTMQPLSLDHEVGVVEPAPVRPVAPDGLGIVARTPGFPNKKETP